MALTPWNDDDSPDSIERHEGSRPRIVQSRRPHGATQVSIPPTASNIDLGSLWKAVRDQWKFVVRVGLTVMLVVLTLTLLMRMNFKATGRLYLGELDNKSQGGGGGRGDFDILGSSAGEVQSEIEIMKSRSIVAQAVARSGLNTTIYPSGWKPPRLWKWLMYRRDPSEIRGASGELTVSDAALGKAVREPQKFELRFSSPSEFQAYQDGHVVGKGTVERPLALPTASFTLHAGDRGLPATGKAYDLTVNASDEIAIKALEDLTVTAAKLSASSADSVKVVTLDYLNKNPIMAATFLRELMRVYLEERQSWKTADATAAESFVSRQLAEMREHLDGTQSKLAEYRANTAGVVMDNEAKSMIEQVAKYEEQRVAARLQVAALSDVKRMLKDPSYPVEAFLLGEANDTVLEGLGKSLASARQALTDLEGRFQDSAPDVRNQKAQIAAQTETIRNYVNGRLTRAQENLNTLTHIIGQFQEKLKTVPGAEIGLSQISRESDVYGKLYAQLLERQQQSAILKASTVSKNRVLDRPEAPGEEYSPKLLLAFASGILGLVLATCIVIFKRFCATTLQSEAEVRAVAGGARLLASIPRRSGSSEGTSGRESFLGEGVSASTEAFRMLRANLYQSASMQTGHAILLTSPAPGDGKTLTTLSLAAVLAADQKWVLVIDADLRKPSHHKITGGDDGRGLRTILSGQCNWRDAVKPVSGPFGEFFSIGAGRMAPGELSSERMARFLIDARSRYDFVLIDGPSFPLVADPLVLAPLADEVVSVFRLGHTPRAAAEEHVRRLSTVAHGFSVVVNDAGPVAQYAAPPKPPSDWWARFRGRNVRDSSIPRALPRG